MSEHSGGSEIGHYMESTSRLAQTLRDERARGDRLEDHAVMLESLAARQEERLAEIARLLLIVDKLWPMDEAEDALNQALAVAEGES